MNNIFQFKDTNNLVRNFFILGAIATSFSYLGYLNNVEHFYHSYLVSFMFWMTLSLGCMFFVLMHFAMNATWSVGMRRIAETSMSLIPYVCLFAIPLYFGMDILYEWTHHKMKQPYLSKNFFLARSLFYFICWIFISRILYYHSTRYSSGESFQILRKWSGIGTFIYALTISFAAFDWLMTLDPHWYSTMFGVYIFAGSFLVSIAFITLVLIYLRNQGILYNEINMQHFNDLARIMFGFTVFWAYIAGFQYYIIWYGNLPEEIEWYLARSHGTWIHLSLFLIFGHFVIPFLTLIFDKTKKILSILATLASLILLMHWIDIYWNVLPNLHEDTIVFNWVDITIFLAHGGFFMSLFWKRFSEYPMMPVNEGRFEDSIKGKY